MIYSITPNLTHQRPAFPISVSHELICRANKLTGFYMIGNIGKSWVKNLSQNWEKCFSLGKTKFWTHWELCPYHKIFDINKGPEYLYQLFDVLPRHTSCEMKALQVYNFTFNSDFIINRELNFSVTRNDFGFGHLLICWWVSLFLKVSYWGQVVEMNFSSINFVNLLNFVSFSANWGIYNEDALPILCYHTGIYFPEEENWKNRKHSLKYKILEKFYNYSSEATTKEIL